MVAAKSEVRDLIVQLTGSPEDEARLAVALSIADDLGTHGIGVHLHQLPDILDITDPVQSVEIRNILEASDREADRMVEWLSAAPRAMRCATQRCRCSWRTNERCVVFNGYRANGAQPWHHRRHESHEVSLSARSVPVKRRKGTMSSRGKADGPRCGSCWRSCANRCSRC